MYRNVLIAAVLLIACTKENGIALEGREQINAFYVSEKYTIDTVLLWTDTSKVNSWYNITPQRLATLKDTTWIDFSKCIPVLNFSLEKLYWKIQHK